MWAGLEYKELEYVLEEDFKLPTRQSELAADEERKDGDEHGNKQASVRPVCTHCEKKYHSVDQCWDKHPHLKANVMKNTAYNENNIDGKDKSGFKCWKCGGDHMKRD